MSDEKLKEAKAEAEQSVAAWLLTLERARQEGDFARAAEAQRELARLGVTVRYGRPGKEASRG